MALSLPKNEVKQIKAQVGTLVGEHGNKLGSHYGSLVLYLTPPVERSRTTDDIIIQLTNDAEKILPEYEITVRKIQGGPPKGKPVEVEITGDSIENLKVVSSRVQAELKSLAGVTSTEVDFEEGKSQLEIKVNTGEKTRVNVLDVARELRRAFARDVVTEIRESDEDIDIKMMLDDDARSKKETLGLLLLKPVGQRIPLSKLVKIEEKPERSLLEKNRKNLSVSGTLDKETTTPVKIAKALESKVADFTSGYPSIDIEFGGENKDTEESMVRLATSELYQWYPYFLCLF